MGDQNAVPRSVKVLRWIARIWGILVTVFVLLIFFSPDPNSTGSIAPVDVFLLSLTAAPLLGLILAWKWELAGGIFTIAMMFVREVAWVILKGHWLAGFLILWIFIVPPAIMFLIAWSLERKSKKVSLDTTG